jgi:hypothetical protein
MRRPSTAFRRPWKWQDTSESFQIRSADHTHLCSIYYEDEPGRRRVMNRLSREEARQFAVQITRFPELLDQLEKLRAARDEPA